GGGVGGAGQGGRRRWDHGGGVSQPHVALIAGCRVTLDLVAHGGPPRREHRGGVSQPHLALVAGRRVTLDLVAHSGPARREHRGGVSQLHLALIAGCHVTLDPLAHNGPPGIHDLMHRMSPVYESPPSWYPHSLKVSGLITY